MGSAELRLAMKAVREAFSTMFFLCLHFGSLGLLWCLHNTNTVSTVQTHMAPVAEKTAPAQYFAPALATKPLLVLSIHPSPYWCEKPRNDLAPIMVPAALVAPATGVGDG